MSDVRAEALRRMLAAPEREPGEDDKAYALRDAHAAFQRAASPEGVQDSLTAIGPSFGGLKIPNGPWREAALGAAMPRIGYTPPPAPSLPPVGEAVTRVGSPFEVNRLLEKLAALRVGRR